MYQPYKVYAEWTTKSGKRKKIILARFYSPSDAMHFEAIKKNQAKELARDVAPLFECFYVVNHCSNQVI